MWRIVITRLVHIIENLCLDSSPVWFPGSVQERQDHLTDSLVALL